MTERFKPFCAVFLVLQKDGKVLLQRRRHGSEWGWEAGIYSLPSGHIEDGEPATSCIIREVKEELCVDVAIEDLQFIHALHAVGPGTLQYVNLFFSTTRWVGEPTIGEPDKADELCWVSTGEIPENTIPFVGPVFEAVTRGEIYGEYGWSNND